MFNIHNLVIESFIAQINRNYLQEFGAFNRGYADILAWISRLSLENILNSDALYHNVDHTIMVTLAGQEILRCKNLKEGGVYTGRLVEFYHRIALS